MCSVCRYESHYGIPLGRRKGKKDAEPLEEDGLTKKKSLHVQKKLEGRRKDNKAKIDPRVEEQFLTGRLLCKYSRFLVWVCHQVISVDDLTDIDTLGSKIVSYRQK